jgi:hypothetical protein
MSLEVGRIVLLSIMAIGLLAALYYLIKDRVDILRSIKPNSWLEFFGLRGGLLELFLFQYVAFRFLVNILLLVVWVPF